MGRRGKTSAVEDLIVIVARLPWWGGVAAAALSFLVLHAFAVSPGAPAKPVADVNKLVDHAFSTLVGTIAYMAQIAVPVCCLVAAAISAWKSRERSSLITAVAGSSAASSLNDMSWPQFERLVGEGFRLQGFAVAETGGVGTADGGVDLVLKKGRETFLVQCKQWRAFKVAVSVVRELYGVMAARGAAGGFVVTSGTFTSDAIEFAAGRNITLIDGPKLHAMIRQAKAATPATTAEIAGRAPAPVPKPADPISCTKCQSPMIRRTSRKGAEPGRAFWGCSRYPACKAIVPID